MSDNDQTENNGHELEKEKALAKEPVLTKHDVVGIRFRSCGKIYDFEINGIEAPQGTKVIVESEMGLSLGTVVNPKHEIQARAENLKKVIRLASERDLETAEGNRSLEDEAKAFCAAKAKELGLEMKVVITETTLDKKKLIFYFTSDGRVDFRELVRDLASKFKTRIEMRQIGVRDEVKMLGGFGVCGRQTCCSLFLTSFAPVTIRMAKQQDLSINQSKLSGVCGRLMCCLGYEVKDKRDRKAGTQAKKDKMTVAPELPHKDGGEKISDEQLRERTRPRPQVPAPDKKTDEVGSDGDKKESTEDKGKKQRHFKRGRRRSRKRKPTEDTQAKPVAGEQQPVKKEDGAEPGKPSRSRRRARRRKKQ